MHNLHAAHIQHVELEVSSRSVLEKAPIMVRNRLGSRSLDSMNSLGVAIDYSYTGRTYTDIVQIVWNII